MSKAILSPKKEVLSLRRNCLFAAIIWSLIIFISSAKDIVEEKTTTMEMAQNEALTTFNKDIAIRYWATKHGGVYVPETFETPANPYLKHLPNRDILLPTGKKLTLMNPAYMLRQVMDEYSKSYGVQGKITSLKVLNPVNEPDDWHRDALLKFEEGVGQIIDIVKENEAPYIRLFRPLMTKQGCLKCHAHQGYKVGEVRGGVSVSIPLDQYFANEKNALQDIIITHGLFWLIGLFGTFFYYTRTRNRIEEKLLANKAIHEKEALILLLLNSTAEGIYGLDTKGHCTFCNKSCLRLLGYVREDDLLSQPIHSLTNQVDENCTNFPMDQFQINEIFDKPDGIHVENGLICRVDGTKFNAEYWAYPVVKDETIVGVVVTFIDISKRIKTIEKLAKSEKRFRDLTENSTDWIWEFDENDIFTYASPGIKNILGYTPDEIIGKSTFDLVSSNDREQVAKEFTPIKETRQPFHALENINQHKNGQLVNLESSGVPIISANGKFNGYRGIDRDITERKKTELTLMRIKRLLDEAQEIGNVGGWEFDPATGNSFWTDNSYRLFGYEPGEIQNIHQYFTEQIVHPDDQERLSKHFQSLFDKKQKISMEYRIRTKTGMERIIHGVVAPELDERGQVIRIYGSNLDITDIKKMERELHQIHKMEAVGTISGGIAHDFNNILGIIIGNTELAIDDVPEWNPGHKNLKEIKTAAMRASGIVKQLLSFSRKTEQTKKIINILPIIKETIKLIRSSIPTTIEIELDVKNTEGTIKADSTQIHQILINLCTNAAHAMDEHGGILTIGLSEIEFDTLSKKQFKDIEAGVYIQLTVNDTGIGIDNEIVDKIFDPYFTTKEIDKGSGMGLSVVHGIVKSYNGDISVYSEYGRGTSFKILFPCVNKQIPPEEESLPEIPTGNEKILFIDDEEALVKIGAAMLKRLGYQVVTETNSVRAISLIKADPSRFDLIITDMTMPNLTGDQLTIEVLKINSKMPVILCTGFSNKIDMKKAIKIGARSYIEKPLDKNQLANSVRRALDNF